MSARQDSPSHPTPLRALALWLVVTLAAVAGVQACDKEVTDYDALRLVISSEPPLQPGRSIGAVQLSLRSTTGPTFQLPLPGKESELTFAIPPGRNIVTTPYTVDVAQPPGTAGIVQLRVLGVDGNSVLTAWSGVVDTRATGVVTILLRAPRAECDADGDGVADCDKADCCEPGAARDCNDDATPGKDGTPKGFAANPFSREDPCTQCGNGIDEDCDGSDTPCVDGDGDTVPDCQESACGASAAQDSGVYPGAVEVCDGKDNDCNHLIDDALPTATDPSPTHAVGDACGVGACAGGQWTCVAGQPVAPMVCSTDGKKAAKENCANDLDDDCDGKTNQGCALSDIDGDGFSNEVEKVGCKYAFAMYHAEFHPDPLADERCCPVGTPDPTSCDTNCDGKTTACHPDDKDGDGWTGSKDCDDSDPWTHFGAAEKCGDGKSQSCTSDVACGAADKDGDGWLEPADCNDADKGVNPEAIERCNGVDDNCNGIVDDGNPDALDAKCGNINGECGNVGGTYGQASGWLACKHYKFGQSPDDALDCSTAFDPKSGTCLGCDGDQRPKAETCDGLDNDCNAKTDEGFAYTQDDGTKLGIGATCDGVGGCGKGVVECLNPAQAACSTDVNGSASQAMAEGCNNTDDNCNGQTDENLTTVSGSTCTKAGVCGAAESAIQTVCIAGVWHCDYAQVPGVEISNAECVPGSPACNCASGEDKCHAMVEVSCDGLDNDCDGVADDDFVYTDFDGTSRMIGEGCLTGACGGGQVVCTADKATLTCDTAVKASAEQCNYVDDDCDGKSDEASDLPVEKSTCALTGVCAVQKPVAACVGGQWTCDYGAIAGWQSGQELACDALDNDCDGETDEDFEWMDGGAPRAKGDACGTGACAGGQAVCAGDQLGLTCSGLSAATTETCDGLDNDCDGVTDPVDTLGCVVYLHDGDGDGFGQGQSACLCGPDKTTGWTATQAGDCNDANGGVHPGLDLDACTTANVDDNCDGATDPVGSAGCTNYFADEDGDGYGDAGVASACLCTKTGAFTATVGGDCDDNDKTVHPGATETCNGKDDDCDGTQDVPGSAKCVAYYVDGDADGFGAAGTSAACLCVPDVATQRTATIAGDCDDAADAVYPGATEVCNGTDDNCTDGVDEGVLLTFYLDSDGDGYGDALGTAQACTTTEGYVDNSGDCDDTTANVHPGAAELCNGVDDDCAGGTDESWPALGTACGTGACAGGLVACAADKSDTVCSSAALAMPEACSNSVDDNCDGATDEPGCAAD